MEISVSWIAAFALLGPSLLGVAGVPAAAGSAVNAAHAEALQGGAARTLSQFVGCLWTSLPALPANAQWSSACRQTTGEASPGTSCAAECLPGFSASGSRSLTCVSYNNNPPWVPGTGAQDLACTVAGCPWTSLPAPPANAQWSAACRQTAGDAPSLTSCAAECLPGFSASGSRSLTCVSNNNNPPWVPGTGAQDLTCTGCSGTPGGALPPNAVWDCAQNPASLSGSTCSAACQANYVQVGSWSSLCAFAPGGQAWQAPSGSGVTCTLGVPQGSCPNSPGPAPVGISNAQWACAGQVTPSGSSCQASCAPGYANVAATVREAACLNGVWRQPTGSMSCVQGTAPCLQPPPSAWLPFAGKWDCKFTPHAAACTASCDARYTKSGNTLSWCYNGQYQQPTTNITCTPNGCSSNPGPNLTPNARWACKLPAVHGANCTANCNDTGTSFAFYPTIATCKLGGWVYAGGTCAGESVKVYYLSLIIRGAGEQELAVALAKILAKGTGTEIGKIIMEKIRAAFGLIESTLEAVFGVLKRLYGDVLPLELDVSLADVWVADFVNRTLNGTQTQARHLLTEQGMSQLVIGVHVSFGEGIVAKTVESVVDAAVNTPSFLNFVFAKGVEIGRNTYSVDESILQQATLSLSDSAGNPLGASAGAGSCLLELTPSTAVNSSAGIISADLSTVDSAVAVCAGASALTATYTFQASGTLDNDTKLAASNVNSNTTTCIVSPDVIPVGSANTSVAVTCRNINGTPFSDTASYQVVVTASSNCSGLPLLTAATTDVTTVPHPTVTLRLARPPAPVCGGKPAVAVFQYTVNGVQPGQDFSLTAQVGANCTANLTSTPSKANGTAAVTCSGAFAPGVTVPVGLNITATTQGCGASTGSAKGNVSVLCCTRGSSYAKTGSSTAKANCFKHVRPGAAGPQCAKASAASGFFNRGPGAGKLFLAQNASSCTDAVGVGSVRVSCPEGGAAKKLLFKLVTPAAYRSFERRYWVGCAAPPSSAACPGSMRWVRINATSTLEFNVTAPAGCSCASAYHGIVDFAAYRRLPLSACGK
uniref:Sushi domain-containing protein n=1 Tax=Tetradesmus obliquus TaxID=3088 RepID=A0A383W6E4_TETOB